MDRSEVKMEDAEKRPEDLENVGRETESNVVYATVASEQDQMSGLAVADEEKSDDKMTEVQLNEAEDQHNIEKDAEGMSPGEKATEYQIVNEKSVERQNPSSDAVGEKKPSENGHTPPELPANESGRSENEEVADEHNEPKDKSSAKTDSADDIGGLRDVPENENENEGDETCATNETGRSSSHLVNKLEPVTPQSLAIHSATKVEAHSGEKPNNWLNDTKMSEEDECGTSEEQAAFMKELESFYKAQSMDFKPPKFYGQPLNCLKLWRAVIKLGGYDRVTGSKLWRQVGESFHPPKTCTTVSWTFRIFYEKALLEYERHKRQSGELELPVATLGEQSVEIEANGYQAPGSGRQRRDAAARAMQGWHAQRLYGLGEVGEPVIKDKSLNNMPKREKNLKNIGSLKQKRPSEVEHTVKAARTDTSKQLVTTVVDVGPPADWVKINVHESKDCFEVYALVPGLLREEVRVQSDPAGRLVITGQPEQPDNPWGIRAFKKVVSLPERINPLQTSAVVSLHGRLYVRVPFEQPNV